MFRVNQLKLKDDARFTIIGNLKVRSLSVSRFLQSVILFSTILLTVPALGDVFAGAKIGLMMVDVPSSKDPTNIAVDIGYEFDSLLADLSLVGEISRTVNSGTTEQGGELDFESDGIYLVWKSTRSVFVTLRGGAVKNETITGSTSHRSDGILVGGSIGVVIGRSRLQVEFTSLAGDANFLGIGLEF